MAVGILYHETRAGKIEDFKVCWIQPLQWNPTR